MGTARKEGCGKVREIMLRYKMTASRQVRGKTQILSSLSRVGRVGGALPLEISERTDPRSGFLAHVLGAVLKLSHPAPSLLSMICPVEPLVATCCYCRLVLE